MASLQPKRHEGRQDHRRLADLGRPWHDDEAGRRTLEAGVKGGPEVAALRRAVHVMHDLLECHGEWRPIEIVDRGPHGQHVLRVTVDGQPGESPAAVGYFGIAVRRVVDRPPARATATSIARLSARSVYSDSGEDRRRGRGDVACIAITAAAPALKNAVVNSQAALGRSAGPPSGTRRG